MWQKSKDWVTRFVQWFLSVINLFVDWLYDRLDLWQNKQHGIASFKKIRSLILFLAVVFVDIYVVVHSTVLPVTFLLWTVLAMLAASFGENVLLSFFDVLKAQRLGGDLGTVQLYRSPGRDPQQGIDPPPEPADGP